MTNTMENAARPSTFALLKEGWKMGWIRVAVALNIGFFVCVFLVAAYVIQAQQRADAIAALNPADIRCLTDLAFHEARGEGAEGMLATMIVFHNRAQMGYHGADTICAAVYDPMQASYANHFTKTGADPVLEGYLMTQRVVADDPIELAVLRQAEQLAVAFLLGEPATQDWQQAFAGVDHYLTVEAYNKAKADHWSKHPEMVQAFQVGEHKFFRWKG